MALVEQVKAEIDKVLALVDESQLDDVEPLLTKDKRIFVLGAGRSGLMARAFAMRLMHIGYTPYVIGETITPSVQAGDVLVAVSGSGTPKASLNSPKKRRITVPPSLVSLVIVNPSWQTWPTSQLSFPGLPRLVTE